MPLDFVKSRQNLGVCYSACGDLLSNHFLSLAFVFDRISHPVRFSTKSTKSGQDYRAATGMIFILIAGLRFDLTRPAIFDPFRKKALILL
jgi:hypothetical protein